MAGQTLSQIYQESHGRDLPVRFLFGNPVLLFTHCLAGIQMIDLIH